MRNISQYKMHKQTPLVIIRDGMGLFKEAFLAAYLDPWDVGVPHRTVTLSTGGIYSLYGPVGCGPMIHSTATLSSDDRRGSSALELVEGSYTVIIFTCPDLASGH